MGCRDSVLQTRPCFLLCELAVGVVRDALVLASDFPLVGLLSVCLPAVARSAACYARREAVSVSALTPNSFFSPAAVLSDYESAEDSEVRGVSVLLFRGFCQATASCVIIAQNPVCVLHCLPLTLLAVIAFVSCASHQPCRDSE